LRDKIEIMLREMAGDSKVAFAKLLIKHTSFVAKDGKEVNGKSNLSDISEKAIPVTYGKVKEAYEEWKGSGEENIEKNGSFDPLEPSNSMVANPKVK
ncbi:unnamed protein product, partial [marine sediment metagenome]